MFVFLGYQKNFPGTQKRVWINHGKRAIGARVIAVLLCTSISNKDISKDGRFNVCITGLLRDDSFGTKQQIFIYRLLELYRYLSLSCWIN